MYRVPSRHASRAAVLVILSSALRPGPAWEGLSVEVIHVGKPQQPELRRSEQGQIEQANWARKESTKRTPKKKGRGGPVPEENRPGHGPESVADTPDE